MKDTTYCLICDSKVPTAPGSGLTLTFRQETAAVKLCDDCKKVAEARDYL